MVGPPRGTVATMVSSSAMDVAGNLPAVFGIPVEFILFALTLIGVALLHRHTLQVALAGLTAIVVYKLGFTGFNSGLSGGYDGIIVEGAARKPTYLFINDGKAELRDAGRIWGKGSRQTEDLLRDEVGIKDISVVGRYALNFRWSDGHDTAIYSFQYLRDLCDG